MQLEWIIGDVLFGWLGKIETVLESNGIVRKEEKN